MSDHVRKLDLEFTKPVPNQKPQPVPGHTPSLDELGATRVPHNQDAPYTKNQTDSDPFNFDIKSEQHGDNVTTGYEHSEIPLSTIFQYSTTLSFIHHLNFLVEENVDFYLQ